MKPMMLLLSASLMIVASSALAQNRGGGDACSNSYGECMNRCSTRPGSMQESCAQMCETNTNTCYLGVYGRPAQGGPTPAPVAGQAPASEPEARAEQDEAKPEPVKPKRR